MDFTISSLRPRCRKRRPACFICARSNLDNRPPKACRNLQSCILKPNPLLDIFEPHTSPCHPLPAISPFAIPQLRRSENQESPRRGLSPKRRVLFELRAKLNSGPSTKTSSKDKDNNLLKSGRNSGNLGAIPPRPHVSLASDVALSHAEASISRGRGEHFWLKPLQRRSYLEQHNSNLVNCDRKISDCHSKMVSTRHHPRSFPEPATPSTSTRSNATDSPSKSSPEPSSDLITATASPRPRGRPPKRSSTAKQTSKSSGGYAHKVPPLLMIWLVVSLPLVLWDTGYIALRPHSMPGGRLHSPLWVPYALYGTIDYVYGWPAWNNHVGFTAAQASLNVVETALYLYYMAVVAWPGTSEVFSFRDLNSFLVGEKDRAVSGPSTAAAVLLLFSAAVMTLSKTVLYCRSLSCHFALLGVDVFFEPVTEY